MSVSSSSSGFVGPPEEEFYNSDMFDGSVDYNSFFINDSMEELARDVLLDSDGTSYLTSTSSSPNEEDLTDYFFDDLRDTNTEEQKRAAQQMTKILKESIYKNSSYALIRTHIPTVVRLATECPFQVITDHFAKFLIEIRPELEERGIVIPKCCPSPSRFFAKSVLSISCTRSDVAQIFQQAFFDSGRVSHLTRILVWHPIYCEVHYKISNFIMRGRTNLPFHLCNFLAMMAAARMKCSYLVHEQEREFLLNKGNPAWLAGFHTLPKKIQKLAELNVMLAHHPWRIRPEHIQKLLKGEDSWTIPELVHALIIMTTFHSLAGFVWGMGITPEVDDYKEGDETVKIPENETEDSYIEDDAHTEDVINKLRKGICDNSAVKEDNLSRKVELFAAAERNSPGDKLPEQSIMQNNLKTTGWSEDLETRFNDPWSMKLAYEDFNVKSNEYSIFHFQDYSWGTHAYALIKRYYSGAERLLDDCFKCIRTLTYKSFNNQQAVDTKPFRMAIWYYVHRVQGIFHDDYGYRDVNVIVHQRTKRYIKKMLAVPSTVTQDDVSDLGIILRPDEKAHIALLVYESRKQAELLYGLSALEKCINR